ncbi:MAG: VOC family protein [Acetatifactor sp.]|nr:VOC family protein [Acetatifactor sp.]
MTIQHITIQTAMFEEEIEFYEKFVDLKIKTDLRDKGQNIVFLADDEGGSEIEIINVPEADLIKCQTVSIGFHAQNLDELYAKLQKEGFVPTPFIEPVPNVRFFFVNDPAGLRVQFI